MLLEIKAWNGRVFLRLARDNSLVATCSIRQVPLIRAARVLWVLRAAFHMQGILAYKLDSAGLVLRLLLVVARGHDTADTVFNWTLMTISLLVSCDAPADTQIALDGHRATWLRIASRCHVVTAQLAAAV